MFENPYVWNIAYMYVCLFESWLFSIRDIIRLTPKEWMFAYIETCTFGYMFAIMFLYIFNYQTFKMNQLTQTCLYICLYVRMFVCLCACMFTCLYVCMFVCLYVCMFVCMYVSITTLIISYYQFFNVLFCLKVWLLVCLLDNLKFHLMRIYFR